MTHLWLSEQNAVDKDLSVLFSEFDKTGNVRYEEFLKIWKSHKLSRIHCGRRQWHEKKRATERLFRVISKYLTEVTPFQFRIAAIYALYAAYHSQLNEIKTKIRLTPTMWKELKSLKIIVKEQQHLDAEFIINSMVNNKVFMFCSMPFPLEYLQQEFMLKKESAIDTTQIVGYEPDEYVQDLVENLDVIDKISKVEEDYLKTKEKIIETVVAGQKDQSARVRLSRIEENLHGSILDYTEDFHHWLVTKTSFGKHKTDVIENLQLPTSDFKPIDESNRKEEESIEEETKPPPEPSESVKRMMKIEALKMKAFKAGTEDEKKDDKEEEERDETKTPESTDITKESGVDLEISDLEAANRRTLYRRSAVREVFGKVGRPRKRQNDGK